MHAARSLGVTHQMHLRERIHAVHRGYECKKHLLCTDLHRLQGDVDVAVFGRILLDEVPLGHVFRM